MRNRVQEKLGCIFPWNVNDLSSVRDEELCQTEEQYRLGVSLEAKVASELMDQGRGWLIVDKNDEACVRRAHKRNVTRSRRQCS